jgi:hypothetical protein
MCEDTHTGDPTPVEFDDSARIPSIGFQCSDVMNDLLVSIPVVKLTSMTHTASSGTGAIDTLVMPPPCNIPPSLPPPEPPPLECSDGVSMDATCGHPQSFPVGWILDDTDIAHLTSPITPFEFPFDPTVDQYFDSVLAMLPEIPSTMDSVTRVITNPCVCGLNGDSRSWVRTLHPGIIHRFSSMVDGGANLCLTGTLSLLVDTVSIPPMPISVAVEGAGASIANCCTKRSLLLLQLEDGGVYFQPCYYCENAVETIISPQVIVNASDTFVEWSQTGYKDNSPGTLRFYSDSGLASMTMNLTKQDGLYYTHTDVLTFDKDLLCCVALMANWLATPPTPKTWASHHNYAPVSKAAHTEAEL